jgi:hypothetical protein
VNRGRSTQKRIWNAVVFVRHGNSERRELFDVFLHRHSQSQVQQANDGVVRSR